MAPVPDLLLILFFWMVGAHQARQAPLKPRCSISTRYRGGHWSLFACRTRAGEVISLARALLANSMFTRSASPTSWVLRSDERDVGLIQPGLSAVFDCAAWNRSSRLFGRWSPGTVFPAGMDTGSRDEYRALGHLLARISDSYIGCGRC